MIALGRLPLHNLHNTSTSHLVYITYQSHGNSSSSSAAEVHAWTVSGWQCSWKSCKTIGNAIYYLAMLKCDRYTYIQTRHKYTVRLVASCYGTRQLYGCM